MREVASIAIVSVADDAVVICVRRDQPLKMHCLCLCGMLLRNFNGHDHGHNRRHCMLCV